MSPLREPDALEIPDFTSELPTFKTALLVLEVPLIIVFMLCLIPDQLKMPDYDQRSSKITVTIWFKVLTLHLQESKNDI